MTQSERQLQCHLPDSGGTRSCNLTKAAKNVAFDATELRVIKNIEEFRPEFQIRSFCDQRVLVEREVPVVYAGTMEEAALGIAEDACGFRRKWGCIEPLSSFSDVK